MTMHLPPGKSTAALTRAASCKTHLGAGLLQSVLLYLSSILPHTSCCRIDLACNSVQIPYVMCNLKVLSLALHKSGFAISCRWPYFAQWGAPTFSWGSTFAMLAGAISAMVESVSCPASS